MSSLARAALLRSAVKCRTIIPSCSMYENPYLEKHKKMRQVTPGYYKTVRYFVYRLQDAFLSFSRPPLPASLSTSIRITHYAVRMAAFYARYKTCRPTICIARARRKSLAIA